MPPPYSDVPQVIGYGTDPGGPFTPIDACVTLEPSLGDEPFNTFTTGCRTEIRRGHTVTFGFQGADYDDFAGLRAAMEANQILWFETTYMDGGVGVLGPSRIEVRPFLQDLPFLEVYTAANTVTSTPATTPLDWTSQGLPLGENSPDVTIEGSGPDRIGRPYWGRGLWHLSIDLRLPVGDHAGLILLEQADPLAPIKLALETEVGDYLILGNLFPHVMIPSQFTNVTQQSGLYGHGTSAVLADFFTVPATVQRFFARWELTAMAATTQPSTNIWTYTPPA